MSSTQPSGIPTLNKLSNINNLNVQNINDQLNLVDDTCTCSFCQAIHIIQLGSLFIPISQEYLNEIWFKDNYLFNRMRDHINTTRKLTIPLITKK